MKKLMRVFIAVLALTPMAFACGWVQGATEYNCGYCWLSNPFDPRYYLVTTRIDFNTCDNSTRTVTARYECGTC